MVPCVLVRFELVLEPGISPRIEAECSGRQTVLLARVDLGLARTHEFKKYAAFAVVAARKLGIS